jgi:hypothetical protein
MRFYIPIDGDRYLCVENGKQSRIVHGEPDPFSRVTCPPILWDRVQEDLPYLPERDFELAKSSEIAYTRLWED